MCCTYSIICWSNTIFFSFFEYFSCFGKCFVSKFFSKIQKFSTLSFGDSLASHASHKAPVASLHKRFRDFLSSETSSHEKYLEIFSKILGFCYFRDSFSRLLREWKSNREVTQRGSWLTSEWKSQSWKRLREIFQNLAQGILATHFGDLLASHMSCEKRVFCTNKVKSQTILKKNFSFPRITCKPLCLLRLSLSQNCHFHSQNLHFPLQSSQSSRKGMCFQFFSKILGFCPFCDSFSLLSREWKPSRKLTQRGSRLIGEWMS